MRTTLYRCPSCGATKLISESTLTTTTPLASLPCGAIKQRQDGVTLQVSTCTGVMTEVWRTGVQC